MKCPPPPPQVDRTVWKGCMEFEYISKPGISVRDQLIWGGGYITHTFLVRFAQILNPRPESRQRWKPRWGEEGGGGGGGGTRALFFTAPESVLYFSIGLGVHELQVIPVIPSYPTPMKPG